MEKEPNENMDKNADDTEQENPEDTMSKNTDDTEQENPEDTVSKNTDDAEQENPEDTVSKNADDVEKKNPKDAKDTGSKALITDKKTLWIISGFGLVLVAIAFVLGWMLGAGSADRLNRRDSFKDFTVARVNGLDVYASDVGFYLVYAEYNLLVEHFGMFPEGEIDYSSEIREGVTLERAIREEAVRLAAMSVIQLDYAEQMGLSLSDDELQSIDSHIQSLIAQYGETELNQLLLMDDVKDLAHLTRIIETDMLLNKLLFAIIDDPNEFAKFEQYMEEEEERDEEILAAKHILVFFDDFDSEEEAAEFAKGLWERALAGEDFDMLVAEYGQDPGMISNPEGYTFVEGYMVLEFEEATKALEIGEISEPVRSSHGLHIILRVEPDLNNVLRPWGNEVMSLEERMSQAIFIGFEELVKNADIVFLRRLDRIEITERT